MDSQNCWFSTTEGGHCWQSYEDIVNTFGSIAVLSGGTKNGNFNFPKVENRNEIKKSEYSDTMEEIESLFPGAKDYADYNDGIKIDIAARDEALHNELRTVCGPGFSNELIERYWTKDKDVKKNGFCSIGDERRTGRSVLKNRGAQVTCNEKSPYIAKPDFSGSSTSSPSFVKEEGELDIGISFKKSQVSKKQNSTPALDNLAECVGSISLVEKDEVKNSMGKKKKKFLKCRNALIIGLQKQNLKDVNQNCDIPSGNKSTENSYYCPDFVREPLPNHPFFPNYDDIEVCKFVPSFANPDLTPSSDSFSLNDYDFPPLS